MIDLTEWNRVTTVEMPAGEYYVGDPCYVLSSESNDIWLAQTIRPPGVEHGAVFHLKERKCVAFRTLVGDGVYPGNDGFEYGVDSGCIGAIPTDAMDWHVIGSGTTMIFDEPFACIRDGETGRLTFGDLVIETG